MTKLNVSWWCLSRKRSISNFSSSFCQKKRHLVTISWERLNVCLNALSHLFVLLLDFPSSPARLFFLFPFLLSLSLSFFSFFLYRWILIMMHTHTHTSLDGDRKTLLLLLFAGIKVSLIVHQQCAHIGVFTAQAVDLNYLVYVHTVNVRSPFVVNWVFTFEDGRVCVCVCLPMLERGRKRLKTIDESTLYWCLSVDRQHSSSLQSCLVRWSYLKINESLTSSALIVLYFWFENVFVSNEWQRHNDEDKDDRVPDGRDIRWCNSSEYSRHQWLSLILTTFSYSDPSVFWSMIRFVGWIRDAHEDEDEGQGVNLSNKLTPN